MSFMTRYRKDDGMMPLTMAKVGEPNTIKRIGGREETKKFLENLGFVTGGVVSRMKHCSQDGARQ